MKGKRLFSVPHNKPSVIEVPSETRIPVMQDHAGPFVDGQVIARYVAPADGTLSDFVFYVEEFNKSFYLRVLIKYSNSSYSGEAEIRTNKTILDLKLAIKKGDLALVFVSDEEKKSEKGPLVVKGVALSFVYSAVIQDVSQGGEAHALQDDKE